MNVNITVRKAFRYALCTVDNLLSQLKTYRDALRGCLWLLTGSCCTAISIKVWYAVGNVNIGSSIHMLVNAVAMLCSHEVLKSTLMHFTKCPKRLTATCLLHIWEPCPMQANSVELFSQQVPLPASHSLAVPSLACPFPKATDPLGPLIHHRGILYE